MATPSRAPDAAVQTGLTDEQLADERAQNLPDREALSILNVGGLSGGLPVPVEPEPSVSLPDPSVSVAAQAGAAGDADLANVPGNVGDVSDSVDPDDVTTLMDPRDLSDLREIGEVIGAPVNGEIPAAIVPPDDGSSTLD